MKASTPSPKTFLKACSEGLADVVFPGKCCICGELGRSAFCDDCRARLQPLRQGSCARCAIDDADDNIVCQWMGAVDVMRAAFDYQGTAGEAVKRLKYDRALELASPMGEALKEAAADLLYDFVVPVPIHWSRRSQRGFNQATEIACAAGLGQIREGLLTRKRATWPQARIKGADRRNLLQGAFAARAIAGARVLLLDDVVTSGGTLEGSALALKAAGASWVGAVVYAVELPNEFRNLS